MSLSIGTTIFYNICISLKNWDWIISSKISYVDNARASDTTNLFCPNSKFDVEVPRVNKTMNYIRQRTTTNKYMIQKYYGEHSINQEILCCIEIYMTLFKS